MIRRQLVALFSVAVSFLCASRLVAAVPADYQPNYDKGYTTGYSTGYKSGFESGKVRGNAEGTDKGNTDGYRIGWDEAYQPAFDRAYDAYLPVGQAEGWNEGLLDGYDEGLRWAPIFSNSFGSITMTNYSPGYFGGLNLSGGSILNSGSSSGVMNVSGTIDWATHYYRVGYDDGRDKGLLIGGEYGYDFAFPTAYAAAYKVGYSTGTSAGTVEGTREGGDDGYDGGWDLEYGSGFDEGFAVGLKNLPYVPSFLVRPVPEINLADLYVPLLGASGSSVDTSVPEPGSFWLIGSALFVGAIRRSSRRVV